MRRYLRIYIRFIKNTIIREMEFRLNFFIWGMAMLVELGINLLFFNNLYGNIDNIAGWDKYELFFYIGFVQLLLAGFMVFIFPNLVALPWLINSGELDYLLLKPINSQFLISLRNVNFGYLINIVAGIVLMLYGGMRVKFDIGPLAVINSLFYSFIGTLILYSIFFNFSILSIWIKRAEFASTLFFSLWSFMRNPSTIYGNFIRCVFTYVFPILLVCTVPVEILLKKINYKMLLSTLIISILWFGGSIVLWRSAVKHYSSASA